MKLALGSDHAGFEAKQIVEEHLREKGYEVVDKGAFSSESVDYPDIALAVAKSVADEETDAGILLCGTGIGMSIAANKVRGAYAALISDAYSAVRAEKSNNANIACFGAFTLGEKVMESLLRIWLSAEYQDGTPSAPKVQRIVAYENEAAHDQYQ